jgi:pre-peptidase
VLVASNDSGNDATGNYVLILAHTPGAFVVPEGDEGGTLTSGVNHPGAITVGDLDQWTFTATAGETISLTISEVSANTAFVPWMRLRGPSGALVSGGNVANDVTAQINVTAQVTGTYTVVVASNDSGNDAAGDYEIRRN